MNRETVFNDMALPAAETGGLRHITLGTLAMLERLGNPCLPFLLGTATGEETWTDHVEGIAEVLYLHQRETDLSETVATLMQDPVQVHASALSWASNVSEAEASRMLVELLQESRRVKGSMVEPVKVEAAKRKNA